MNNHHLQKFRAIFDNEDDWLEFASSKYLATELVDSKVYSYFESDGSRHVFLEFNPLNTRRINIESSVNLFFDPQLKKSKPQILTKFSSGLFVFLEGFSQKKA